MAEKHASKSRKKVEAAANEFKQRELKSAKTNRKVTNANDALAAGRAAAQRRKQPLASTPSPRKRTPRKNP